MYRPCLFRKICYYKWEMCTILTSEISYDKQLETKPVPKPLCLKHHYLQSFSHQTAEFKHLSVLKYHTDINVITLLPQIGLIQSLFFFFQISRDVQYTLTQRSEIIYSLCMQIPLSLQFSSRSHCVRFEILMPFLQSREHKA